MNVRPRCPAECEQRDGNKGAGNGRELQALFRLKRLTYGGSFLEGGVEDVIEVDAIEYV